MNKKSFLTGVITLLLLLTASSNIVLAQVEMSQASMLETPVFYYDIANFAVPDDSTMCRLHFYFKVFNDKLTFIKIDSVYKARYEISLVVLQDDNQVDGDIWKDEIITDSYAKTNSSRDFQITHVSFDVEPGDYQLAITFEDLESEQVTKEKLSAHLRDFSKQSLILSDITLASRVEVDSVGLRGIQPEIANYTFAVGQPIYAYFEIYDTVLNREVKISYEVKNIKNKNYKGIPLNHLLSFRKEIKISGNDHRIMLIKIKSEHYIEFHLGKHKYYDRLRKELGLTKKDY